MTDIVTEWLDKYRTAWASNDPDDIRAMFTEDATYAGSPFDETPWTGHDGIVAGWLENEDTVGQWSFDGAALAYDPEKRIGFIEGRTQYSDGPLYANLWVVHFADDGRATSFVEWYMKPDK